MSDDIDIPMTPLVTARYSAAVEVARNLHGADLRKGTRIPYLSHLLSVSALVLEHGGDEDQAIAALLHDAAEDHGGLARIAAIRNEFGDRVGAIVEACSDSLVEDPERKAPWHDRKRAYLAHLATTPDDAVIVTAADKLHNARCILSDVRRRGDELWTRFNRDAGHAGVAWYYNGLAVALRPRMTALGSEATALADELERTVAALIDEVRGLHPDLDTEVVRFDQP